MPRVRPFVSVNMAASIDGKIATPARGPVKLGSRYDSQLMAEIRAAHDAVVVGGSTFRAHPETLRVHSAALVRKRLRSRQSAHPASVVISKSLRFPRGSQWERDESIERWVFCGAPAPRAAAARLAAHGVRVVRAKGTSVTARFILTTLRKAGHRRVLLEGGGELNAVFFSEGLVDRVFLTLCPSLVGGKDSPTICEGEAFPLRKLPRWRTESCRRVGDEVYFVFGRLGDRKFSGLPPLSKRR